jgi:hypothetical protein
LICSANNLVCCTLSFNNSINNSFSVITIYLIEYTNKLLGNQTDRIDREQSSIGEHGGWILDHHPVGEK